MKKLFVICGPTATGKTGLSIKLAKKFNGEIISADSRQIYKGMDIGTGKDLPQDSKISYPISDLRSQNVGCYLIGGVRIWGYDIVSPKDEFSVSHYIQITKKIIRDVRRRRKLPILVGGSGLYIRGVVDGIETSDIPPDEALRSELGDKSSSELFNLLVRISPAKASSLNDSDRNNTRRLVRAIEIAQATKDHELTRAKKPDDIKVLFIGLKMPAELLAKSIEQRVQQRIESGQENELRELLSFGITWDAHSMKALGYSHWKPYFDAGVTLNDVRRQWAKDEVKYAKRQMTWFKKDKRIKWFDVSSLNYELQVEKEIEKWQNKKYAKED